MPVFHIEKEHKQAPKVANWLYQMVTMFRKTYLIDLLANLEDQFTCAERLVGEGRAFFDKENLQRLKSIPPSEVSTRFMQSVRWKGDSVITKGK
jgi:hypothetical protein